MISFAGRVGIISLTALFIVAAGMSLATTKEQYLYTCKCGKKCDCNAVDTEPGKCPCGKKLKENNILGIKGDKAVVCDCGGGCVCDLSDSDPEMCSCGVPIDEVSLKGLYVCACGDNCSCKTISKEPGVCACNKELQKVE